MIIINDIKNAIQKDNSLMDWIVRVIKGAFIGVGAILPGLSGGVLAVIFGIYDRMISFLANPFKSFAKNVFYFIPVGIGFGIGILLFSYAVSAAFASYQVLFVCLFLGFVVGTFPSLSKQAGKKGRNKKHLWITMLTAIVLFAIMNIIQSRSLIQVKNPGIIAWTIAGFLIGLGMIIPGLSTSNFLMYFGMYSKMTDGITKFNLAIIIPIAIGLAICVLLFSKFINNLLKNHYAGMFHFILGTVIGSTLAILTTVVLPAFSVKGLSEMGLSFGFAVMGSVILFIIGVAFSYWFSTVEDKYTSEEK